MASLIDVAKQQGYTVTSAGNGFYKITNPSTGKSTMAWEGTRYTGSSQLSNLGAPSSTSSSSTKTSSSSSGSSSSSAKSSGGSSGSTYSGPTYAYNPTTGTTVRTDISQSTRDLLAKYAPDTLAALDAGRAYTGADLGWNDPSYVNSSVSPTDPQVAQRLSNAGFIVSGGTVTGNQAANAAPQVYQQQLQQQQLQQQQQWYQQLLQQQQQQLAALQQQLAQAMQPTPPPQSQTATITQAPTIEVPQGQQQATTDTSQTTDQAPKGAGGFVQQVTPLASAPNVDDLYRIYQEVTGKAPDEATKQYLTSPQFQSVLGGNVPMWMSADPIWRLYLMRLGYLPGNQNNQARQEAIQQRLQAGS